MEITIAAFFLEIQIYKYTNTNIQIHQTDAFHDTRPTVKPVEALS